MISIAGTLAAPFPWFGGYAFLCIGQSHPLGCRPVRFVTLFVDHDFVSRAFASAATHWSWNASRWIAKWSALLKSSKFFGSSLSLSSSLWWTPNPGGIGPFSASHTTCARNFHLLGSATFTHARFSFPRLCLVRITTVPTGCQLMGVVPWANCPSEFFMPHCKSTMPMAIMGS